MADITIAQNEQLPVATETRYRDMSDGTHALVVSADVAAGGAIDADIRVGGAAVSNANPVPMSDAGGSLTVDQATHDNLNANANMQVGDADASTTNPVPTADRTPITKITQTPTITAGAYTSGDAVGGLLTFANAALAAGRGGYVTKVVVIDDAGQNVPYELHLFDQAFTAMADNAPWGPSDADMHNWEGAVPVAVSDRFAGVNNSGSAKSTGLQCPLPYTCVGTSLFGQLVVRGAPTYAATDDIVVKLYVERR